jgi:hypothetical protein
MDGAESNFRKAHEKLSVAGDVFLGVDVGALRRFLEGQMRRLDVTEECRIALTPALSQRERE